MAKNAKDYFWTATRIAEEWGSKDVDNQAENIRRRFKNFLTEELGFCEDEVAWFRAKTSSKAGGQFIFGFAGYNTPNEMKKLLDIEEKKYITSEEKDELMECLAELLPVYRKVDTFKDLEDWKKSVDNNEEDLELEQILDKEDNRTYKKYSRMAELVEEYYKNTRIVGFFENEIFVSVDAKKVGSIIVRRKIYCEQYQLICDWALKWYFIMQNVEAVRVAERFDNGYKKCVEYNILEEDAQKFYKTGKVENKDLAASCEAMEWIGIEDLYECTKVMFEQQKNSEEGLKKLIVELELCKNMKDVNEKDKCYENCEKLIIKIMENSLKKTAKEDYDYIILRAYKELEEISDKIKKRQDEEDYCDKVKGRERTDIEKLHNIRMMIENRNMNRSAVEFLPK